MALPALKSFSSEAECKTYFIENYCKQQIFTHDGIRVQFYDNMFEHSFYTRTSKNWKAKKDHFAVERGERIDWIKAVLEDPTIVPHKGWDKEHKRYDNSRRVALLTADNYVVIIMIVGEKLARFVTAYLVDDARVANLINNSPVWEP